MKKPSQNALPLKRLKDAGWSPEGSTKDVFWLEVPYKNQIVGFIATPVSTVPKISSKWIIQTYIGTTTKNGEMYSQDLEPIHGNLDYVLAIGNRAQLFLSGIETVQKK